MTEESLIVHVVPHSHIDTEWYWQLDTCIDWSVEIISLALGLMRRDPDYRFTQDQVTVLEPVYQRLSKEDREFLKEMVAQGRFEIAGAMYTQPEVAEPHGETLVRQILYGLQWFEDVLGAKSDYAWLIDTFGQINQLPQILASAGVKYYVFGRDMPPDLDMDEIKSDFWYESPDGTRLQTHWMPGHYGVYGGQVKRGLERLLKHRTSRHLMVPWGDDVIRPSHTSKEIKELVGAALEELGFPGAEVQVSTAGEYLEAVQREAGDSLPTYTYDFNPPYRVQDLRGCWDGRYQLKREFRRAEYALFEAEVLCSLAVLHGQDYPGINLGDVWRRVCHTAFHDIIGGSHADPVYVTAMGKLSGVIAEARAASENAARYMATHVDRGDAKRPVLVFNSMSFERFEVVCVEASFAEWEGVQSVAVLDGRGKTRPSSVSAEERYPDASLRRAAISFLPHDVPAFGYSLYRIETGGSGASPPGTAIAQDNVLENEFYRITVDPSHGGISSLVMKSSGKELIAAGVGFGNELIAEVEDDPNPEGLIHLTGEKHRSSTFTGVSVQAHSDPLGATLTITGPFQDCTRIQEITLRPGQRRIDFRTTLEDFSGGDILLKTSFPLAIDWGKASIDYETPYATTKRPEGHFGAQTWVDCGDGEVGAALMNHGPAGYWVEDGRLELVIMRSYRNSLGYQKSGFDHHGLPEYEHSTQMRLGAEHGRNVFEYALLPHAGGWREAGVVESAHSFNQRLPALLEEAGSGPWPPEQGFLSVEPAGFEIVTIKEAEESDSLVLRGYETAGQRTEVTLRLPAMVKSAWLGGLREDKERRLQVREGTVRFDCRPHQIVTLMLEY